MKVDELLIEGWDEPFTVSVYENSQEISVRVNVRDINTPTDTNMMDVFYEIRSEVLNQYKNTADYQKASDAMWNVKEYLRGEEIKTIEKELSHLMESFVHIAKAKVHQFIETRRQQLPKLKSLVQAEIDKAIAAP